MSVHGEFSRALESVIDALRSCSTPESNIWLDQLELSRLELQPDLSSAARAALAGVERMNSPPERIEALGAHLASLCCVILGISAT